MYKEIIENLVLCSEVVSRYYTNNIVTTRGELGLLLVVARVFKWVDLIGEKVSAITYHRDLLDMECFYADLHQV